MKILMLVPDPSPRELETASVCRFWRTTAKADLILFLVLDEGGKQQTSDSVRKQLLRRRREE